MRRLAWGRPPGVCVLALPLSTFRRCLSPFSCPERGWWWQKSLEWGLEDVPSCRTIVDTPGSHS